MFLHSLLVNQIGQKKEIKKRKLNLVRTTIMRPTTTTPTTMILFVMLMTTTIMIVLISPQGFFHESTSRIVCTECSPKFRQMIRLFFKSS